MTALKTTVCFGCGTNGLQVDKLRADGGHERVGLTFNIDAEGNMVSEVTRFPVPPCPGPVHTSIG